MPAARDCCRLAATLCLLALTLVGCQDKQLTKANVDLVAQGMTRKQVESILGMPSVVSGLMKDLVYVYKQGQETVSITFKDDKVDAVESTLTN